MISHINKIKTLLFFLLLSLNALAQHIVSNMGRVTYEDFSAENNIDSGAGALVLFDIGSSAFEGDVADGYTILFKRHVRIKILNTKGLDAANEHILLYHENETNREETFFNLEGYTYNLEGNNIVSTKLDKSNVFKDKFDNNYISKSFTLPNVKVGSIIEYSYKIRSDFFFNIQPWIFQGKYPCLWSEYSVKIPSPFSYIYNVQGPTDYFINEEKQLNELSEKEVYKKLVMKNVVPIKPENYMPAKIGLASRIDLQLKSIAYPRSPIIEVMGTWEKLATQLKDYDLFGQNVYNDNWLNSEVKDIIGNETVPLEKAKKIYYYIINNIGCIGNGLFANKYLKDILTEKKGSSGGINLLLTAMLRNANLTAYPLILNTKSFKKAPLNYPLLSNFNYTICYLNIDSTQYLLDASNNKIGFNNLPFDCYNGHARIINKKQAIAIDLTPNNIYESKDINVNITSSGNEDLISQVSHSLGIYESVELRKKLINESSIKDYVNDLNKQMVEGVISNVSFDSLKNLEEPVTTNFTITSKQWKDDIVYFNPILLNEWKENPFKSSKRIHPIEMPYALNQKYTLTLSIPNGYKIEELPKNEKIQLYENEGLYQYYIQVKDNTLQVSTRLVLPRANYDADENEALRGFFNYIIKKNAQQIVFKKIK